MSVLPRSELEQSPLADLHALASELGMEGYRRLRKAELISAILRSQGVEEEDEEPAAAPEPTAAPDEPVAEDGDGGTAEERRPRRSRSSEREPEETRTGVLDVLSGGSGFMRADPFVHSPDDVYVSPAQIKRCELRAGDEISGPVRRPRRSERYASLVHVESVNGSPPEEAPERTRFEETPAVHATERLTAPDGLEGVPFGKGSRVVLAGPAGSGATTLVRRIAATLAESHTDIALTVVLAGVRPEEVAEWREVGGTVIGGSFDEQPERLAEAAVIAVERGKRAAERGEDAVVIVDSLDGLTPGVARRVLGAGRNLEGAGSLTVIATAGPGAEPAGVATTRIVLERAAEGPRVSPEASGTLRADLLG